MRHRIAALIAVALALPALADDQAARSCRTAGCIAQAAAAAPADAPVAIARPGAKAARAPVVLVLEAATRPAPDGPPQKEDVGPIRYMVRLFVLEADGSEVELDAGTFDSVPLAVAEVERFTVSGLCVVRFPDEPDLTCYPPARHLRTLVERVWY